MNPIKNQKISFYYRPIIPFTLALIFGIMIGEHFPGSRTAAWLLMGGCTAFLVFSLIRKKTSAILPLALFGCLGYLLIQPWVSPRFPVDHIRHAAMGEKAIVSGVVVTSPVVTGFRQSFIIETATLGGNTSHRKVTGKLRVSLSGTEPKLNVGDRISFVGRIRLIRSFHNPGGFEYNRYMAFKGVWVTASGQGESVKILRRRVPVGLEVWVSPIRKSVAELIDTVASADAAGVLKALLLGDRSEISDSLREAFQRVGIGHLLAISGLHVGLVAGTVFFAFFKLFGYFPPLLRRAWARRTAAIPAFLAVWGYGILAGMSPSTQRAVLMASVFLAAFFVERPQDTLNSVAVAAMAILILHPPSLFAASFQLSFAAVVTIVLGFALVPSTDASAPREGRAAVLRRAGVFIMVSLAAILGALPLALYYFNETSVIGLLSNLIFVPVIGFGVVPLGLVSVFLFPLSSSVAALGLKLCAIILSKALFLIRAMASLPFAAVTVVTPSMIEIILYYCLLAATGLMVHTYLTGRRHGAPRMRTRRIFRFALGLSAFAIIGFAVDGIYWEYQRFWTDELKVTIIDVGHGSAGLVEIPGGEVLLIDGGGFSDNSVFDVGKRIVAPLLWRKKIRTVQTLILSHPNSDHLNGLIYIAGRFHVKRLLSNGESADTRGYRELMSVVREQGIRLPAYESTKRTWSVGGVDIDLLYPIPGFLDEKNSEPWRDDNNDSLVIKVSMKKISFLFPGDIMAAGENELVRTAGSRLQSRVLVAPHHGSRTSSSEAFLEAVNPDMIVVSSGWNDRYGVPHPEVLKRYKRLGARIFTTAEMGAVSFETDGETLHVETAVP